MLNLDTTAPDLAAVRLTVDNVTADNTVSATEAKGEVQLSGTLSNVATTTVRIDSAAPTATAKASATGTTRTITLAATDARSGVAGISYRIGAGATVGYTKPFVVPAGATVTFAAVDLAGNASPERVLTTR